MINIAKIEAKSLREYIDLTVDLDGELYRFSTVVYDSPDYKFLSEII
jgi:hypothetical protein